MNDLTPAAQVKDIVCKNCAHGKHWHKDEGPCTAPEGPGWSCDCQAWDYGKNIADIDLGGSDE
jgi:hypothetical protein